MASCAFFSFAAETIFIAEVICIVDDTDTILLFNVSDNNQLNINGIGTIKIGNEFISYVLEDKQVGVFKGSQSVLNTNINSNSYSFSSIIRGTNNTSAKNHMSALDQSDNDLDYSLSGILLTRDTNTLQISTIATGTIVNLSSTTITLTSGTFYSIAGTSSGIILIDNEIIKYTSTIPGSYQITGCIRGYANTSVSYHLEGTSIYKIDEPYFINLNGSNFDFGYVWEIENIKK